MSNECTHYWDKADDSVTKSTKTEMEWTKKEYCDKCYHVRLTFMRGDKDKDGVVQNIHVVSEKIRPQTEVEKEQRATVNFSQHNNHNTVIGFFLALIFFAAFHNSHKIYF